MNNNYNFLSINESSIKEIDNSSFKIYAPGKTDYFNSPIPTNGIFDKVVNAPFYYNEWDGNFTLKVKVKNNYESDYDACAIFIYEDDNKWIKLAHEKTDFDTTAIVSVVTNHVSDDCNGVNVDNEYIWLMASRLNDTFSLHYSLDGKEYILKRIFHLSLSKKIKVGLMAQSPTGDDAYRYFYDYSIKDYYLKNIRSGEH